MRLARLLLLTVSVLFPAALSVPQEVQYHLALAQSRGDLEGKDPAAFPRVPGYRIIAYQTHHHTTGHLHSIVEGGKHKGRFKVEGRVSHLSYEVEKGKKARTGEEIMQHYRAIVAKLGGEIVYDKATDFTARVRRKADGGGTVGITWLYVHAYTDSVPEYYVTVVEQKGDR